MAKRVPDDLWLRISDRAKPLADAIMSLVSHISVSSPPDCVCDGKGCLRCVGSKRMLFLLRPSDPESYRRFLLTDCSIVVDENAPSLVDFNPKNVWSQKQVVTSVVETMAQIRNNVICSEFDRYRKSSPIVDCLTTSSWALLLRRVGDDIMFYLLKNTSIFLLVFDGKYNQVVGPDQALNLMTGSSSILFGFQKKRRRVSNDSSTETRLQVYTSSIDDTIPKTFQSQKRRSKMAKTMRVPEVLWKLYKDKAKSLAETIVSLVPMQGSSAGDCRCRGKGCLLCSSADMLSFLLRPDDPLFYCNFLKNCFVVVSDNVTSLPHFSLECVWSQRQIVTRVIEMIIHNTGVNDNVICTDYDKYTKSSHMVELLTSAAWDIFHHRVGDGIVIHLLKHTSIFVPFFHNKHYQVAGSSIVPLKHNSVLQGTKKKQKTIAKNNSEVKRSTICYSIDPDRPTPLFSSNSDAENNGMPSGNTIKPEGRFRPFRWQRKKQPGQLTSQGCIDKRHPTTSTNEESEDRLTKKPCQDASYASSHNNERIPRSSGFKKLPAFSVAQKFEIDRRSMFYDLKFPMSILPRKHVLNTCSYADTKMLMKEVLGLSGELMFEAMPCILTKDVCLSQSPCLYHSLLWAFNILLHRTKCCQHFKLLDKHCPIKNQAKSSSMLQASEMAEKICKSTVDNDNPHSEADKPYCSKHQVVSFVWAACRSIVPSDLLGSSSNWRILRRNIARFIGLRRYEKFSLKQCIHNLRSSGFTFFFSKHISCYSGARGSGQNEQNSTYDDMKQAIFVKWISWLFSDIVMPLIQSNFYVTESQHGKQEVFYYRKSLWYKLTEKAITELKGKRYFPVESSSATCIIRSRNFGFSKLRILPKQNDIRMVANLKSSSRLAGTRNGKVFGLKSVNCALRDTHVVLKGIQLKEPEKLGSSVFDYNDIYRKICPFLVSLKNGSAEVPSAYILLSDVSKAFDSINHEKLLNIMKDVISNKEYRLEQSHQVLNSGRHLWTRDIVRLADTSIGIGRFRYSLPFRLLHGILVDQGKTRHLSKRKLFDDLKELVKRNILQLRKRFYLQQIGIPQGGNLSTLLCSFYYGHLERNVIFPFLEDYWKSIPQDLSCSLDSGIGSNRADIKITRPSYLLIRLIDDFLFISTSKNQATSLFSIMQKGFQDYNCYMNEAKSCHSFDIGPKLGSSSNKRYAGEDGISFIRWGGILINCCTLEIQADYTRYSMNHLRSTFTVSWQNKPFRKLEKKLRGFLLPKCHALFFDANINSPPTVRLNIYQVFLLAAMKFHCHMLELSSISQLRSKTYHEMIVRSIRYMYKLIRRRMHSMRVRFHLYPVLEVEKKEVIWLGLNAFIEVLKKKQSRYRLLLNLLRFELASGTGEYASPELIFALDRSHSSSLWQIKF